jgi:hypothetical protein
MKKSKKEKSNSIRGKKSRAAGARFELKVRADLEAQKWIVDRWLNNIDLEKNKLAPAKRRYNPYLRVLSIGTGFPDFLCFRRKSIKNYEIIGVEVKKNGWLDKLEREKCRWLLENKIFQRVLIAKAIKQGRKFNIEYIDFEKKYK